MSVVLVRERLLAARQELNAANAALDAVRREFGWDGREYGDALDRVSRAVGVHARLRRELRHAESGDVS